MALQMQVRCSGCGSRLFDVTERPEGKVTIQHQCRDRECKRLLAITIEPGDPLAKVTMVEVGRKNTHHGLQAGARPAYLNQN